MIEITGKVLGERYRVDRFLGRGGMADVYQVWDLQRAVPLACKILHAGVAGDAVFLRRFEREAQIMAMLQHPNIVRCYGLEESGGLAFLVMDYIDGFTLRKEMLLHPDGMPPERVLAVMRPVCAALHYAHGLGLVHCDIKPGNLMIQRNGAVFVTDFGLARASGAGAGLAAAGTPGYMAPEQIRGREPTPAVDIYALGVTLNEMLTGQRPGAEAPAQQAAPARQAATVKPSEPARLPAEFETIVRRCLEEDPTRRYASTLDLLAALEAAVGGPETDEPRTQVWQPEAGQPAHRGVRVGQALKRIAAVGAILVFALAGLAQVIRPNRAPNGLLTSATTTAGAQTAHPDLSRSAEGMLAEAFSTPARTPTLAPSATPQPTPTGGGGWIAFASDRNGTVQIWITDALNPEIRRQLTDEPGGACQPAWSPDGSQLAFTTPCSGPSLFYIGATIKLVRLEDKAITNLGLPVNSFDPAWSPDGSTLAYTALFANKAEVRALDLQSRQSSTLSSRGSKAAQPAWSPDGKHLAFISSDDLHIDALWIMEENGSSPELVNSGAPFSDPLFSPDGRSILATTSSGGSHAARLALIDRSDPTLAAVDLFSTSYTQNYGAFSPDSQWVAYWSELTQGGKGEILVNRLNGQQVRQITTNQSRDFQPAWGFPK